MKKIYLLLFIILSLFFISCTETPHSHLYGEWIIVKEATEEEEGLKERTCECGEKETEVINKLEHVHKYSDWIIVKEATEEEEGLKERTCECGEKETEVIDKLEHIHKYSEWIIVKQATEEEEGLKERICECGEKETEVISKLEHVHKYVEEVINPTCADKGYTNYTCSCGYSYKDNYVDELSHNFEDWVLYTEPTIDNNGKEVRKCKDCDFEIESTINIYDTYVKYELINNEYYEITEINNEKFPGGKIIISEQYRNLPVKGLKESAFNGCDTLTSIEISKTIEYLGENVISNCINLETIIVNEENIKFDSRNQCNAIIETSTDTLLFGGKSTDIPNTVVSIASEAFLGCKFLFELIIPNTVGEIGKGAFKGCDSLEKITIPFVGNTKNDLDSSNDVNYSFIGYIFGAEKSTENKLFVPSSLKIINITSDVEIKENAFLDCYFIKEIIISETVNTIGKAAFSGCLALEKITLPFVGNKLNGTENFHIGYIFGADNYETNNINVPQSLKNIIISGGNIIEGYSFYNCNFIKEIILPETIEVIGEFAFEGCISLTNINIPNKVKVIEKNVFATCKNLKNILLPSSLEKISEKAFYACSSLEEIIVPDSVIEIGIGAFESCNGLTKITIPFIGNLFGGTENNHFGYIFGGKDYLNNKFCVSTQLKEVVITNTELIDTNAFYNCSNIINITLTKKIKTFGIDSFKGCESLENVYFNGSIEDWCLIDFNNEFSNPMIFANSFYIKEENSELINNYIQLTEIKIPDSITTIKKYTFNGFDKIENIILNEKIYAIEEYAFGNCSILKELIIPNSLGIIRANALANCTSLEKITIPFIGEEVDGSGYKQFYKLFGMYSNYLPVSLKEVVVTNARIIRENAFINCKTIEIITLSEKTTELHRYSFSNCESLKSIIIPNSVTTMYYNCFENCKSMTSITMPFIWTEAPRYSNVLYNLFNTESPESLTEIIISGGETICDKAFYGCGKLEKIVLPSTVKYIGKEVFNSCNSLKTIIVDENNEVYDSRDNSNAIIETNTNTLLYGCSSTVIPNTIMVIESGAFASNGNLNTITIPASVTSIGLGAFKSCVNLHTMTFENINCLNNIPYSETVSSNFGYIFGSEQISQNSDFIPTSLDKLVIIDGNEIRDGLFSRCSINYMWLPNSIKTIGKSAFSNSDIHNIYLPSGLTFIDENAFYYVNRDMKVYYNGTIENWCNINFVNALSSPLNGGSLGTNKSSIVFYILNENNEYQKVTNIKIPNSICKINDYTFLNFNDLESIELSNNIVSIGYYAFANCTLLNNLQLSDELLYIDERAFSSCESLEKVYIPDKVIKVGSYAFHNCKKLNELTIGKNMLTIENYTFYGCTSLSSVSIPNNITTINNYAFYNCSSLKDLLLSEGLTYIGDYSFDNCNSLEVLTLPNSLKIIGEFAFYNCSSLKNIVVPNNTNTIGKGAFSNCIGLESITLPFVGNTLNGTNNTSLDYIFTNYLNKLQIPEYLKEIVITGGDTISKGALKNFKNIESLTLPFIGESINSSENGYLGYIFCDTIYSHNKNEKCVPESLKEVKILNCNIIAEGAFVNCKYLTKIVFPETLVEIGNDAFKYCYELKDINIPKNVNSIGLYAFAACTSLEKIELPDKIKEISYGMFSTCINLSSIKLPNEITKIGDYAFYDCIKITNLQIPDTLTSIGKYAFCGCAALNNIVVNNNITRIDVSTYEGCINLIDVVIPEGITWIDYYAFKDCTGIMSIEISSTVNSINNPFSGCSSIEKIIVNENNKTYDSRDNCNAIITNYNALILGCKNTIIPSTVVRLGNSAFERCLGLTEILIPDSVYEIGWNVFGGCENLVKVTLSEGLGKIDYGAFKNCINLKEIVFPNSLHTIGYYAFSQCEKLESITFSNSLNKIETSAFSYCYSLKEIMLPESLQFIGEYAFSYCKGLTYINIPEGVTEIEQYAFWNCENLKEVILPNNLTKINRGLFSNCYSLINIIIPETVTHISSYAFKNCKNLQKVRIQSSTTIIEDQAFPSDTVIERIN